MVRGRGGQPTRGARGGQMGTRGGRINKNIGNPDFGFSYQTKNTYGGSPRTGGYNKNNSNNNYGGGQQQQPNYGGGQQQQPNYNAGQPQQNNSYNNQNQNKPRYPNNQNNNQNNRFSGNTPNNNNQGNNPSYNNQNRGQNNKGQGQNQNYNNSAQNRNNNQGYNKNQGYNSNQGYNNNQGYNKPNQNYNNSGPQFNDNGNNSAYPQRNQNSNQQGYSNNNPAFDNNFGQQSGGGNNYNAPKPSLLGSAPSAPAPVRNEPSSDDILKEIGKVFLTSMTGAGNPQQGANPMAIMNMMQGGPGGPPPNNNPSRYDNFYNDGNQFTNYNPPMFNNYRGGYGPRGGRGGPMMNTRGGRGVPMMNTRGGMRPNNMRGGKFNNQANQARSPGQNRRVQGPGAAPPGVKRPLFKSKNNPNYIKGKSGNLSPASKTIKYAVLQVDKSVEENKHPLVAFLRQIFYDLSVQTDNKSHFMMMSRILLKHQNVIKLLSYEVKKALDKKFGEGTEEEVLKKKQNYLKETKTNLLKDYKVAFKGQENMDVKEKAIEEVFPILTGEAFTDENVPKPEDYVANLETGENEYINAFKIAFIKSCLEKFIYRINNGAMPTKSVGKRVSFFLDNGFMSHLLVDKVKLKTNAQLPPILAKYSKVITNPMNVQKIENMTKSNYENMKKTDEHLQTDIADYIGGDKVNAEVLRDFADCIILFDKTATALKYKLLNYTPYINLPAEQKKSLFDEIVHSVYSTAMNILKNNIKSSEKKFEDMEKDEVEEGEEKVKEEAAADDDEEDEEAV